MAQHGRWRLQQRGQYANQERKRIQGKPEEQHVGEGGHWIDTQQNPGALLLFSQGCHRNNGWPQSTRYVALEESLGVLAQLLPVWIALGRSFPLSGRVDGGSIPFLVKI